MKTMKNMIAIMVALTFLFSSDKVIAQTNAENHTRLSAIHQSIITHTNAIASGEAKTKNDQVTHYNEFRRSLAEAKKTHNLLKKVIPEKAKSEAVIHHDNIDKYYASATSHANAMMEELKNEKPDDAKLKDRAKKLRDDIQMAEKENQALIKESL